MPNSCRFLLVIPVLALAPVVSVAADASTPPPAERRMRPRNSPDWAPKPRPNVVEDRLRVEVNLLGASPRRCCASTSRPRSAAPRSTPRKTSVSHDFRVLPQVELSLLPGERHLVRLSAFAMDRSAAKRIEKDISFDDEDYFVGERVDSLLNITMFGLTYGYRFLVRPRGELTGTLRRPDRRRRSECSGAQPRRAGERERCRAVAAGRPRRPLRLHAALGESRRARNI